MDPAYPIGKFKRPESITAEDRIRWMEEIAALPGQMREAVYELSDHQLDIPYRPGGWTARQVVHHVADSHMNSYIQVGAHRRRTRHQALRRGPLGGD
jgi:hypothetical protein